MRETGGSRFHVVLPFLTGISVDEDEGYHYVVSPFHVPGEHRVVPCYTAVGFWAPGPSNGGARKR